MSSGRGTILLIEDNDGIREVLWDLLSEEGYDVTAACNGQEAIDQLSGGWRPCLILLDLVMPLINGWEFKQALQGKMDMDEIPIVVLSANLTDDAQVAAIHAKRCLRKPFDFAELLAIIDEHCLQ